MMTMQPWQCCQCVLFSARRAPECQRQCLQLQHSAGPVETPSWRQTEWSHQSLPDLHPTQEHGRTAPVLQSAAQVQHWQPWCHLIQCHWPSTWHQVQNTGRKTLIGSMPSYQISSNCFSVGCSLDKEGRWHQVPAGDSQDPGWCPLQTGCGSQVSLSW